MYGSSSRRRVVIYADTATVTLCALQSLLALDALELALQARQPAAGLLHHSDRGSPYASEDYREGQAAFREKRDPVFRGR